LVAKPAPSFASTLFDGAALNSKDLLGKTVLVNFWASWCVPCRAEAWALEAAWQNYKHRDVVFLGVNIQDKEEAARSFLKEYGITYLNGPASTGKITIDYGVWGIPETFFLGRHGRITYKHAGELRVPVIARNWMRRSKALLARKIREITDLFGRFETYETALQPKPTCYRFCSSVFVGFVRDWLVEVARKVTRPWK
jgi:cytochrome c biogenesis protein CcmG/thiol:disulfide interchange protein DsbE